jgi:hypothetical protein
MARECALQCAGRGVPDSRCKVGTPGGDRLAVVGEGGGQEPVGVSLELEFQGPGFSIPELRDRLRETGESQDLATVRGESSGASSTGVTIESAGQLARSEIPEPGAFLDAAGEQETFVGGEVDRLDGTADVTGIAEEYASGADVPGTGYLVEAGCDDLWGTGDSDQRVNPGGGRSERP